MENLTIKNLKNKKVHFIGIGGISMSALAMFLKAYGVVVQGSDESENEEVKKLKERGIKVFNSHKATNLRGVDIVVYSSAIRSENVELEQAKKRKLLIIKRAELLGMVAGAFKNVISVAGSHGKTTTTAMISEMFCSAKKKPTCHIGGVLNSLNSNFKIGNKKYFITESCEYMDNYLYIKPDISVILNIDSDHLDYFGDLENVKKSFFRFASGTREGGVNISYYEDQNSSEILNMKNTLTFGYSKKADVYARNIKEYKPCYYSFNAYFCGCLLGNVKLNIVGKHNVLNALATIYVGLLCMIDFCDIKNAIENFSGVKRRCEKIADDNGVMIYHDYAHHPNQIANMIQVAKDLVKKTDGKIFVIFEPHTYSRTKFLLSEFASSFIGADDVIFAPVYSAREKPTDGYDSLKLADETRKYISTARVIDTYAEIKTEILKISKRGDVVLILGAGTINQFADMFK